MIFKRNKIITFFLQQCPFSDKYKTILIGCDTKETGFISVVYRFELVRVLSIVHKQSLLLNNRKSLLEEFSVTT